MLIDTILPTLKEDFAELIILLLTLGSRDLIVWIKNKQPKRQLAANIDTMVADIRHCKLELQTNGGGSLKDMVIQMKSDHAEMKQEISKFKSGQWSRFKEQLNASQENILLFNKSGECTFANEAALVLCGMTMSDMEENGWVAAIHVQKERERIKRSVSYCMEELIEFSEPCTLRNGITRVPFKARLTIKPVWDEDGNLSWFSGKIRLLTNHKQ